MNALRSWADPWYLLLGMFLIVAIALFSLADSVFRHIMIPDLCCKPVLRESVRIFKYHMHMAKTTIPFYLKEVKDA